MSVCGISCPSFVVPWYKGITISYIIQKSFILRKKFIVTFRGTAKAVPSVPRNAAATFYAARTLAAESSEPLGYPIWAGAHGPSERDSLCVTLLVCCLQLLFIFRGVTYVRRLWYRRGRCIELRDGYLIGFRELQVAVALKKGRQSRINRSPRVIRVQPQCAKCKGFAVSWLSFLCPLSPSVLGYFSDLCQRRKKRQWFGFNVIFCDPWSCSELPKPLLYRICKLCSATESE